MTPRTIVRAAVVLMIVAAGVVAPANGPWAQERPVHWKMASAVPSSVALLGTAAQRFTEEVDAISGGTFRITLYEPGALVPPLQMFDAVSTGAVDAAWSPPGFWAGKIRAAPLFSSVPFGPSAAEYLAWIYHGGGQEIWRDILARHDIHTLFCSISAPEASGWFRDEIRSVDDLRGLKMRFFGLGARVMERLGVATQLLAPGDIYPALERGVIDAAELSMPAADVDLGLHQVARHYYFPGWHQPGTLTDLMINMERWRELSDAQRAQVEAACGDNVRDSLARSEAAQAEALRALRAKGVQLHRWPPEILAAFEEAWHEVAAELAADDADFGRAWESLRSFREGNELWRELGYLD